MWPFSLKNMSLSISFWDVFMKELWQVSCKSAELKGLAWETRKRRKAGAGAGSTNFLVKWNKFSLLQRFRND